MDAIVHRATLAHIKATSRVSRAVDRLRNDRGQGTLEYVGIVLAVVALCGVVAMFIKTGLGGRLTDALKNALKSLGVGDGAGGSTPTP